MTGPSRRSLITRVSALGAEGACANHAVVISRGAVGVAESGSRSIRTVLGGRIWLKKHKDCVGWQNLAQEA